MKFTDKVVIVTGASEGIGRSLCLQLAAQKACLVLAARNEERLLSLKMECETRGAKALAVPTDVTDENACRQLIKAAVTEFDRIDCLVNNAGRTMWTFFEEIQDLSIFRQLMELNYLGCVHLTYHALPYLKQTRGLIVPIASVAGLTGVPSRTAYAATKHALFGFYDSLRIELRGTGVDITMVAPDFVLSEIHKRALSGTGEALGESPLQVDKIMTADECAQRILSAMEKRSRLMITSLRGKVGRWVKLVFPSLVDRMAARAIDKKR